MRAGWLVASALAVALAATADAAPDAGGGPSPLPFEAASVEAHASASPSQVRLGQPFTVFVTASLGPGIEVNLREPVELGPAFEVRRRLSEDRTTGTGTDRVREWQLEVVAWELGELQLPPIAVTYTFNGHAGQVAAEAVPVTVLPVLGEIDDATALRGPAPPVALMRRDWTWVIAAGAAAAVLAAISIGAWLRRRAPAPVARGGTGPRRTPVDGTAAAALARIAAVEAAGTLDRDPERKAGYAELVAIVRDYLAARHPGAALELTTGELLPVLAPRLAAPAHAALARWLGRADLVKYADARATAADGRAALATARALIAEVA